MKKIRILMLFSIVCLLIAVAPTFAMNNDTNLTVENASQLDASYYFDSNVENDNGDGSVYNPYKELTSNRIPDNSIAYLANGEYTLKGSKTYANLTVVGETPEKTIIKYNDAVGFTSKGLITLKNVTLLGLRVNINSNSNLTAINTIFKDCSATNSIIYSSGSGTVVLDNCTLTGNSADYGGAIYLKNGKLNITNSAFSNNHAKYWGGAISCEDSEIHIHDSVFTSNSAAEDAGGAIYLKDSYMIAENLEMSDCSALFGGAITSLGSNLKLMYSKAKNNRAKYYGGAVYKMYGTFDLSNSTFENNSAPYGGALFADLIPDFRIKSNYFAYNTAEYTGGAIYSVQSDSYYDIVDKHLNNTFKDNSAQIENDVAQSWTISTVTFDDNYILMHYNSSYNGTLPDRYDLRDFGLVTPVRDQGKGGNCWAFSSLAALESALLKATNMTYDLSEENMKNMASLYSEYGWAMETNTGGYDKMGIGYLTSWLGPVNETSDTYRPDSLLSPLFHGLLHVQNIISLKRDSYTDNDAIKMAIMDYGAVSTSIYWSTSYISNTRNYYYDGTSGSNHAVAIVGWDDNYDASNFKNLPKGNGAWIIKNSWGTSSGENGYFYVSYYDTRIAQTGKYNSFAFVFNDTIKYDKNYQYDIPGRTDYFLNETGTVWYKIKHPASDDEYLAAVSTYFQKDTDWEVSVYVNDTLRLHQSGFSYPGYRTIELNSLIPLNKRDIFEIVFKITVDKEAGVPISEFVSLNGQFYYMNCSFISYDGKNWVDFFDLEWEYPDHVYYSQVACIKAFTVLNPIGSLIDLSVTNINGGSADIVANVFDEYGNPIRYGDVTFNVRGVEKTVAVSNGAAKLSGVIINDGINRFEAKFNAVGYSNSSEFVVVSNTPVGTSVSLEVSSNHNPFELIATVIDENGNLAESGKVTFNIEGTDYAVRVFDGIAALNHTFKTFGLKSVNVTYDDLYCYKSSTAQESVFVSYLNTSMELSFDNHYNPITITAKVVDSNGDDVNQGEVTFYLDGVSYTVGVKDGIANLTHVFKSSGLNSVNALYSDGFYGYNYSSCEKSVTVLLKATSIVLNWNSNDNVTNPVNITATVIDEDNNPVRTGKIVFSLGGENIVCQAVDGKASVSYIFKNEGLADISVKYIDVNYYECSSKAISLNVSRIKVDLDLSVAVKRYDANITVEFSRPIDEYVTIYVDDAAHIVKSKDGTAVLSLSNLSNGQYSVRTYVNSYIYSCDNKTADFSIKYIHTKIIADDVVYYLNNDMYYSIVLKDDDNAPVQSHDVDLTVNGKTHTSVTDSSGRALFKLDLTTGSYNAGIDFAGDDNYMGSNATRTITVNSTVILPSQTKYTLNSKYSFKVFDGNGVGLKNKAVTIIVNSNKYTVYTDSNGNADYNVNLNLGSYTITVSNPVTGEGKTQAIEVVARITGNKDMTMYYGAGSYYKVRVYDDYGNIERNAAVTFTINGKSYVRYSDSDGYASFKISLNPKTYTISATYKGYKVSNKIVVKPTLILKDKTVKKSKTFKYNVKLLNSKGKILKNKKVTVKFRGKTYKAKTNAKGIAAFKIKAYSKTGKFTLTAIYGSAKVSKKITVKK